jgi:YD repeat-containing protein
MSSMSDATGTTTYTYDSLNRLITDTNGAGNTVNYSYDLADNLTALGYPNGQTVDQTYNSDSQLQSVTDWLGNTTNFTYDPDADLTKTAFPTATQDTDNYQYDDADNVTGITFDRGSQDLATLTDDHDNDGLLTSQTSTGVINGGTSQAGTYGYDHADNLTAVNGDSGYDYNAASQLTSSPTTSYTYNNLGQRITETPTSGASTSYSYGQGGQLTHVATPHATETDTYDGNGLLASQINTSTGTTSRLTWDQASSIPLLLTDRSASYIYGPGDIPIEQISMTGSVVTYLHHDQIGSTRLITNQSGQSTAAFSYSAYGRIIKSTGSTTTPFEVVRKLVEL